MKSVLCAHYTGAGDSSMDPAIVLFSAQGTYTNHPMTKPTFLRRMNFSNKRKINGHANIFKLCT